MRAWVRQPVAAAEAIDARVFEEAADDRLDADRLGQAGHAGTQAADPAHDEVDLDPVPARVVEGVDHHRVDERVAFGPDGGWFARLGVFDLLADVVEQPRPERDRRDGEPLEPDGFGIAGDEVEHARHVARDRGIGREERDVGVDARGHRMVVSGPDMAVGRERAALAAHDHRQLAVRLQLDEAEDDLRAGAFEVARPADVRLLRRSAP